MLNAKLFCEGGVYGVYASRPVGVALLVAREPKCIPLGDNVGNFSWYGGKVTTSMQIFFFFFSVRSSGFQFFCFGFLDKFIKQTESLRSSPSGSF